MRKRGQVVVWAALAACAAAGGPKAWAGTSYTSITDSSWFNGANWANDPVTASDDDVFLGQGFTSLVPDGVVFDPDNDAFYQNNTPFTFGTTTPTTESPRSFASVAQIYLAGGSGSTGSVLAGKLTIKSGTLTVTGGSSGFSIGRPQVSGNTSTTEQAALVMTGGTLTTTAINGDVTLSNSQTTSAALALDQNNTLDYTNAATITATAKVGGGLRLDPANVAVGHTANSTVILRHVAGGAGSLNFASVNVGANSAVAGVSNNTVEFHYGGGGVDTVNVGVSGTAGNSLKISNAAGTGGGTINSYLNLVLDETPTLTSDSRAPDLALFALDDSVTGTTANTTGVSTTDATKEFKAIDGTPLTEGAVVSASFGGQAYSWNIYYDGNASGSTITGAATGNDVVLIGQPAAATPEPASVGLIAMGGLLALGRRKRRAWGTRPTNH